AQLQTVTNDALTTAETDSRYAEAGRNFGPKLRVSAVHGNYNDPINGNIQYTKAAADWHPLPSLSLSVRPDYRGDYSYSANWRPTQRVSTSLTRYADRTEAAAEYVVNNNYRVLATELRQQDVGDRAGVFVARSAFGRH